MASRDERLPEGFRHECDLSQCRAGALLTGLCACASYDLHIAYPYLAFVVGGALFGGRDREPDGGVVRGVGGRKGTLISTAGHRGIRQTTRHTMGHGMPYRHHRQNPPATYVVL
jgi:hypothetical protein